MLEQVTKELMMIFLEIRIRKNIPTYEPSCQDFLFENEMHMRMRILEQQMNTVNEQQEAIYFMNKDIY